MIGVASLRWVLTMAFAVAAMFHLARVVRPRHTELPPADGNRASEALHVVMCLAMIVMVWPWGGRVPASVWLGVFTVSAGWFATRAVRASGRRRASTFFATTAAAMIWMGEAPAHAAPSAGAHHGMSMAGAGHAPTGYTAWISAGIGGYLMLAGIWWMVRGMRLGTLSTASAEVAPPNWGAVCHGLMSAGMAVALLAMT